MPDPITLTQLAFDESKCVGAVLVAVAIVGGGIVAVAAISITVISTLRASD